MTSSMPTPGFLPLDPQQRMILKTNIRPVHLLVDGTPRWMSLVQVLYVLDLQYDRLGIMLRVPTVC